MPEKDEQVVETTIDMDSPKEETVQGLREWGDNWKKSAAEFQPYKEFVSDKFGDLENAKMAHELYSGFAGEEFDPKAFTSYLEQLSPARSKQLVEALANEQASQLVPKKVEEIFGGAPTPEEIKMFKTWKESGYALGTGDDIPDELKFDSEGNPRPDAEVEFLRNLKSQLTELTKGKQTEAEMAAQREAAEREQAVRQAVNDFSAERIAVLDNEFEALGLAPAPEDTADQASQKEFLKQFIIHGVSGMFLSDPEAARDYNSALEHLSRGEKLLARRYEPRIERKLVEIFRSKALPSLRSSFNSSTVPDTPRPEISNSGSEPNPTPASGKNWLDRLIAEGKIKID